MSNATYAPFDLCTIVRHPDRIGAGSGLYVVDALIGRTEDDLGNPGDRAGFTYVQLSLITGWFRAEEHPIARILGGPFPGGDVGGWDIDLAVGEMVGLMFLAPTPRNRDYLGLDKHGTFVKVKDGAAKGGFSNGMNYTRRRVSAEELGESVKALAGGTLKDPCLPPYNERPDSVGVVPDEEGATDAGRSGE
jgi:hypothetical protein